MRSLVLIVLLTAPAFGQEGVPIGIGTGVLPAGLAGETDLKIINQTRIDVLRLQIKVLQDRYASGLTNIDALLAAQMELAMAQLETTTAKQERLEFIEESLKAALLTWQRVIELQRIGARGGEAEVEVRSRAAVFKYRAMWLGEKASTAAR